LNEIRGFNRTRLSSVQFPDSATVVGGFSHQTFTGTLTLPAASKLKEINACASSCLEAFECHSLTVERIAGFQGCGALQRIVFPSDGRLREISGFQGASVQAIVIPRSVESLTNGAFSSCQTLTDIVLPPDGCLREIDGFYQSAVREVDLPDAVETVGQRAFTSPHFRALKIGAGSRLKSLGTTSPFFIIADESWLASKRRRVHTSMTKATAPKFPWCFSRFRSPFALPFATG
jgi:hypothetical protein